MKASKTLSPWLLAGILAAITCDTFAQRADSNIDPSPASAIAAISPAPPEPLLVLKAGHTTLILDPATHDLPAYESRINAEWIDSIEMITGDDAMTEYGLAGRNGVIVIHFLAAYTLPSDFPQAPDEG